MAKRLYTLDGPESYTVGYWICKQQLKFIIWFSRDPEKKNRDNSRYKIYMYVKETFKWKRVNQRRARSPKFQR